MKMDKQLRAAQEETGKESSRRVFLKRAAGTGLATVAGVALLPGVSLAGKPGTTTGGQTGGTTPVAGATSDTDILNFALLLERLEAQFYNLNGGKDYLVGGAVKSGNTYQTQALGSEETPPVNTGATANASFVLSDDRTVLAYNVTATGLSGPATAMHLHRGARGVPGDIVYPLNTPDATGAASGVVTFNPADYDALANGGLYLNIHTAAYPNGEIRGQVQATTQGTPTGTTTVTLKSIVDEIREHENAHVRLLEQTLGTSAQAAPQFQNLDAPTLQQFLTMAQTFEDVGVSAYLGQLPNIQNQSLLATAGAIMAVEARHAGGLRAYRKGASTAEGGDPNITLTEDREALNRARTREQVQALIAPYIVGGTTPVTTPTTPTTPTTGIPPVY
jgi:hypothetical protein